MAHSPTTTVRLSQLTHRKIKRLAEESGASIQLVLDQAVELYRRQRFLEDANRAFAALKSNPEAWDEELAERALWDAADDIR